MIESMITKRDLLDFMRKELPVKEPYEVSYNILDRFINLSTRFFQLRYATIYLISILKKIESKKTTIDQDFTYQYGIYFSYIVTELSILLQLDGKSNSYSANRLFNEVNQYINTYLGSKDNTYSNSAIVFDTQIYKASYKEYKRVIKQYKSSIADIGEMRNKYTTHNDLSIQIDRVNFDAIIALMISLENTWYNLAKSMGIITEPIENKKFDFSEYKTDLSIYEKEASKFL